MSHSNAPDSAALSLPDQLKIEINKIGKSVVKSSNYIQKDSKVDVLEGHFSDNANFENSLEIVDHDNETKGWFDLDKYPKWLSYLSTNENIEKCNLLAFYSSNQVTLKSIRDIEENTEVCFNFKVRIENDGKLKIKKLNLNST